MTLMVFLSSRISPFTSTVIFFDKSPRATAVVTSAMLRTWPVRLVAIALTLSVRSFQVPATPFTRAWPPSLPSVPTSRATRVTSDANEASCSTMVLTTLPMRRNSPRSGRPSISTAMVCERSPLATAPMTRETSAVGWTMSSISSLTARNLRVPAAAGTPDAGALGDLAFLADDLRQPFEFLGDRVVHGDDFVEQAGDLAIDAINLFGKANGKVAAAERSKRADELAAINEVAWGLDIHSTLRVALLPHPG